MRIIMNKNIDFIISKEFSTYKVGEISDIFGFGRVLSITELSVKGWCRISFEEGKVVDIGDVWLIVYL